MQKFQQFLEKNIVPLAEKVGKQRHLQAIRDGVIHSLPLILIGSFFLLLVQPPGKYLEELLGPYAATLSIPFRLTYGIISIYVACAVAYSLASSYKMDGINSAILSVVIFFICAVPRVPIESAGHTLLNLPKDSLGWNMPIKYFGAEGLFLAIIVGLSVVEILRFLQARKLMFSMPKGVPEVVAKAFENILPAFIIVLIFWIIRDILKIDLPVVIIAIFMPIKMLGDSIVAVILLTIIDSAVWFGGIHPIAITGPFVRPVWITLLTENAAVFEATKGTAILPHIAVDQFYFWFVWVGGAGATLGVVILLLFAKSETLRQLGKVCIIPGLFNINEPFIFGLPIVANPLMIIPFALAPLVNGTLAYIAFYFNLVQRPYILAPWTLPAPLGALYATGGDWRAMILCLVTIIVSMLIYLPFLKIYDGKMLAKEASEKEIKEDESVQE